MKNTMMQKPSEPITGHKDWDYDLIDHVARALADSHLHVFAASLWVAVPEELGGDPDDINSSLLHEIALVTDSARGWLVLTAASPEVDWGPETDEVLDEIDDDPIAAPHVSMAASSFARSPLIPGSLDLRTDRRARIEATYERTFQDHPDLPAAAFETLKAAMAECRYSWRTEADIRERMNESPVDGLSATTHFPSAAEPVVQVRPNRAARRRMKALSRRGR